MQIIRLARTSCTVTRLRCNAFGLLEACLLCATRTIATCSGRVPYSYMWRMKVGAKFCPALRMPNGTWARSMPRTGCAARAPVPPMRKSE